MRPQYLTQGQLCLLNLTMNENFKIRKNTSLKDIKQIQSKKKSSKDVSNHQFKHQIQNKKNLLKMIHLQPIKSDASNNQPFKKQQIKLDFTQPVNIKGNVASRNDGRYENVFLAPLQNKQEIKQKSLDKENRPSSMNELNYLNMARMKLTLQNTLKNDSSKLIICKKQMTPLQEIKSNDFQNKNIQGKIIKSHSRARLLILGQKDKKRLMQGSQRQETDKKAQSTFRKEIIQKIFQKEKTLDQKSYQTIESKQKITNPIQQSNLSIETYNNSPIMRKFDPIFEVDCSTINQREENASSFISKKAVQQFVQPMQTLTDFQKDKLQGQKKRKLQIDKIRKKFPQNFFK